jgi:hypothetical protein
MKRVAVIAKEATREELRGRALHSSHRCVACGS